MDVDPIALRERYSKMSTIQLLQLSQSGDLTEQAQIIADEELRGRSDRAEIDDATAVYQFALEEVQRGVRGADLELALVNQGLADDFARSVVAELNDAEVRQRVTRAKARIRSGLLMVAAGAVNDIESAP